MKLKTLYAKPIFKQVLLALLLTVLSGIEALAATSLLQVPSTLDFGIVPQESVVDRTLSIHNASSTDLSGIKLYVSCSCLSVNRNIIDIKANSFTEVKVTYLPHNTSGKTSNKIYVHLNDTNTPEAIIKVTADVYKLFTSQPAMVDFGLVPIGTSKQAVFQLLALSDKTFRLDKAIFDSSLLDVEYEPQAVLSNQKPLPVHVALKPTIPVGDGFNDPTRPMKTSIRFTLTDTETEKQWKYSVAVRAKIIGEVEVTPPKYSFIDQPHDARLSLKVQLKNRNGKPFCITGFRSFFGCTVAEFSKEPAISHEVELTIDASKVDGNVEDMLQFMTDLSREKIVNMPVTILFK